MKIRVETLTGEMLEVGVEEGSTVKQLKVNILQLIYPGIPLQ